MSDRWQWVDAFRDANIPTAVLMNMPEEEFKKCCLFLIDAGLAPLSYLKETEKKDPEQEELDRIIEESRKIKEKRDRGTSYSYNPASFCHRKYNVNTTLEEEEEKKEKETQKKNNDFPKTYVWDDDNVAEADKIVKDSIESKYERLEQEQLRKQEEEDKQRLEELKQNYEEHQNQTNSLQSKRSNLEKLELLKPEPKDGIQMAINLPNNKRVMRKIDPNESTNVIYTIVEGQEVMYEKDDSILNYKIIYGLNKELPRDSTFSEQGIIARNLFKVIIE